MSFNPWAVLLVGIGLVLIISGVKGTHANLLAAVTGKATSNTTLGSSNTPPA